MSYGDTAPMSGKKPPSDNSGAKTYGDNAPCSRNKSKYPAPAPKGGGHTT